MGNNKFILGALCALVVVVLVVVGLGLFEESQDGPLENAGEAVGDAVEDATD